MSDEPRLMICCVESPFIRPVPGSIRRLADCGCHVRVSPGGQELLRRRGGLLIVCEDHGPKPGQAEYVLAPEVVADLRSVGWSIEQIEHVAKSYGESRGWVPRDQ